MTIHLKCLLIIPDASRWGPAALAPSLANAASDAYFGQVAKSERQRTWMLEEAAYFAKETNKLHGRDS